MLGLISFKLLIKSLLGDIPSWVKEEFKEIFAKDSKIQEVLEETIVKNK